MKKLLNFTSPQMKVLAHALGVSLYENILSDKKKERVLPEEFYRNYYSHKGKPLLLSLVNLEVMVSRAVFGSNVFHVT